MTPKKIYRPCVNCGINVNRFQKRFPAEESENFRQLLSDWTCKQLEDDDVLCNSCYHLVQESLQTNDTARKFGFKNICLSCGVSITHVQTHDISNDHEHKLFLAQRIKSHQMKRLKHVCYPCWMKTNRAVKKRNEYMAKMINSYTSTDPDDPLAGERGLTANSPTFDIGPPQTPSSKYRIPTITLTSYKRAANTSNRCIFKQCNKNEKLTIPKLLKERLLIDFSFYVPHHARICNKHLNEGHNRWGDLFNQHTSSEFDAEQLEDLFSLLKNGTVGNYCNETFQKLIQQDNVLCKYWLGVDYKVFEDILKAVEPIKGALKNPTKSVAMYLMKRHSGFSDKKVAEFFQVKVPLLNKNIKIIQKYFEIVKYINYCKLKRSE